MVLIITPYLKDAIVGQVTLLKRFMAHFPDDSCVALTRYGHGSEQMKAGGATCVNRNFELWFPRALGSRWGLDNLFWGLSFLMVLVYAVVLGLKLRPYKIRKIFLPTHTSLDIVLAFLLSRVLVVTCVVLNMDSAWDSLNGACWVEKSVTQKLLPPLLKKAQKLFVLNDFMKKTHVAKYGRAVDVLYPPLDLNGYDAIRPFSIKKLDEFCILYTGSIYSAQRDTMENLAKALGLIGNKKLVCYVCGLNGAFEKKVEAMGLADYFRFLQLDQEEAIGAQKEADLLFLGLAFESNIQPVINTAFPAKLVEYLASGRPVLACVPEQSFVSFYLSTYFLGEVLNSNRPDCIAHTLQTIKTGKNDFSAERQNARKIVAEQHNEGKLSQQLWQALAA